MAHAFSTRSRYLFQAPSVPLLFGLMDLCQRGGLRLRVPVIDDDNHRRIKRWLKQRPLRDGMRQWLKKRPPYDSSIEILLDTCPLDPWPPMGNGLPFLASFELVRDALRVMESLQSASVCKKELQEEVQQLLVDLQSYLRAVSPSRLIEGIQFGVALSLICGVMLLGLLAPYIFIPLLAALLNPGLLCGIVLLSGYVVLGLFALGPGLHHCFHSQDIRNTKEQLQDRIRIMAKLAASFSSEKAPLRQEDQKVVSSPEKETKKIKAAAQTVNDSTPPPPVEGSLFLISQELSSSSLGKKEEAPLAAAEGVHNQLGYR